MGKEVVSSVVVFACVMVVAERYGSQQGKAEGIATFVHEGWCRWRCKRSEARTRKSREARVNRGSGIGEGSKAERGTDVARAQPEQL